MILPTAELSSAVGDNQVPEKNNDAVSRKIHVDEKQRQAGSYTKCKKVG